MGKAITHSFFWFHCTVICHSMSVMSFICCTHVSPLVGLLSPPICTREQLLSSGDKEKGHWLEAALLRCLWSRYVLPDSGYWHSPHKVVIVVQAIIDLQSAIKSQFFKWETYLCMACPFISLASLSTNFLIWKPRKFQTLLWFLEIWN